jgi:hypothetical protein
MYKAGEALYLSDDEEAMAADHREAFTEESALLGIIMDYVETPVPANFESMSKLDRKMWFHNRDELDGSGTERIDIVSSHQIWVEALDGDPRPRRTDLLEITEALHQLEGWVKLPKQKWTKYGKHVVFQRIESIEGSELL